MVGTGPLLPSVGIEGGNEEDAGPEVNEPATKSEVSLTLPASLAGTVPVFSIAADTTGES